MNHDSHSIDHHTLRSKPKIHHNDKIDDKRKLSSSMVKKYGLGAKLLSKMGYVEGQGLGKDGSGIKTPIQTEQRPQCLGLGEFSSKDDQSESSDEHDDIKTKDVQFQIGHVINNKSLIYENIRKLNSYNIEIPQQILTFIENSVTISLEQRIKFENISNELIEINNRLNSLKLLENHLETDIQHKIQRNSQLDGLIKILETEKLLKVKINEILKLDDPNNIDKLCAIIIQNEISKYKYWNPLESLNPVLVLISDIIKPLSYQMDTNVNQLNRTQTMIFTNIYYKLEPYFKDLDLSNWLKINEVIVLLLDYQSILIFIGCNDYILQNFIFNKLLKWTSTWKIGKCSVPLDYIYDITFFLPINMSDQLNKKVYDKFVDYCKTWDYNRDISLKEIRFIKMMLGLSRFYEITHKYLVPNFIGILWEQYFNPLEELRDPKYRDGTFYFLKKFHQHVVLFSNSDLDIIIKGIFNEINKILYQWSVFKSITFSMAKSWFNYIINQGFPDPLFQEIKEIKNTYLFLDNPKTPIHDESFDLIEMLDLKDENSQDIYNIPIRKVTYTFKEVLQDFCEENELLLNKSIDKFTTINIYGKESLVPIFQISNKKETAQVAIKDDILWINIDNIFKPIYMYELVNYI